MCEMKTIGAVVLLAALGLGVVGAVEPVRLSDGAVRGEERVKAVSYTHLRAHET